METVQPAAGSGTTVRTPSGTATVTRDVQKARGALGTVSAFVK